MENSKPATKPQKTMLDFFKPSSDSTKTNAVKKVQCPACFEKVYEMKLNWHLDHYCKSKGQVKSGRKSKSKVGSHVLKNKNIGTDDTVSNSKLMDKNKCKYRPDSPIVLDSDDDSEVFVDSSMFETSFHEGIDILLLTNVDRDSSIKIENHVPVVSTVHKMLLDDWNNDASSSPVKSDDSTLIKIEPEEMKNQISKFEKDKILVQDVEVKQEIETNSNDMANVHANKKSGNGTDILSFDSENDFEPNDRTPIKVSPYHKRQRLQSPIIPSVKNLKSPVLLTKTGLVSKSYGKICLIESPKSDNSDDENSFFHRRSMLVTPERIPSPSPFKNRSSPDKPCSPVLPVCQLFTPPGTPNKLSLAGVRLSPKLTSSPNRFALDAEKIRSLRNSSFVVEHHRQIPQKITKSLEQTAIFENSQSSAIFPGDGTISRVTFSPHKEISSIQSSPIPTLNKTFSLPELSSTDSLDKSVYRHVKGYYLENFLHIVATILAEPRDACLLNDQDIAAIDSFKSLSMPSQKLYVRLFQRKIKWNRLAKLDYKDICDKEDTELYVNELSYAGFLFREEKLSDLEEVLSLLSIDEIQSLCKVMKLSSVGKKEILLSALLKLNKQKTIASHFSNKTSSNLAVYTKAKQTIGPCFIINHEVRRVFHRLLLLFSLPRHDEDTEAGQPSQLTTLLMVNMGKMSFPDVTVVREKDVFRCRQDLIRFETCCQIVADVHECMEAQNWEEALTHCNLAQNLYTEYLQDEQMLSHDLSLPRFLRRFTPISTLVHVLWCAVEILQRQKDFHGAVNQLRVLLRQTTHLADHRGRWYDRLALNLEQHLKKPNEAVAAIAEALSDAEVRLGHRLSLCQRAQRMSTSPRYKCLTGEISQLPFLTPREPVKVTIKGRSFPSDIPGYKRVFIRQDSDYSLGSGVVTCCSVEELAIGHYKDQGYCEGLHKEGTVINSLFGIYFWQALYAPVTDAFRTANQAAPLDLDDPHFYDARRESIDQRLNELRSWKLWQLHEEMETIWKKYEGKVSIVAWDMFRNLDHAKGLVTSLGQSLLAAICERLAKDHRFTRSGFPDLIVWDPVNCKCRIVEVKGPNDRLSTKQILWLDFLVGNGADAEVCHVEEVGMKRVYKPIKRSPKKAAIITPQKLTQIDSSKVVLSQSGSIC